MEAYAKIVPILVKHVLIIQGNVLVVGTRLLGEKKIRHVDANWGMWKILPIKFVLK